MDDSEARKKRLEELKQQSLDMEREAQEREKRAEERRKKREEELRLLQEQEKKDEEERQRKRDERRRLREEEDKKLKEDMLRLEEERKQRQLQRENKDGATSPAIPAGAVDEDDPELKKIREEREKRLEEKRKQREEAQKLIELEEKKIAEEREKRREERNKQLEEEKSKLDNELKRKEEEKAAAAAVKQKEEEEAAAAKAKEEADRLEKERLEKEKQATEAAKEEADRLEKERLEKEKEAEAAAASAKAEADRLEKERLEKEKEAAAKAEADRLEKERLEKEKAAKEEADSLEKERLDKEKAAKEEADRLEKEKEAAAAAKAEADRLEKERLDKEKAAKEEADRLEKEKEAAAAAAKAETDRLEKEKLAKEEADRLEKEKEAAAAATAKAEADRLEKERLEKEKAAKEEADRLEKERLAKEKADKEEADRLEKEAATAAAAKAKEEADRLEKERLDKEKAEAAKVEADRLEKERLEKEKEAAAAKAKEEEARLEREKVAAAKAEVDRLEKERLAKEKADKEEADRLEKEKKEKEAAAALAAKAEADRLEKERLEKEKAAKEEADRLEKERLAKEKEAKEEADRLEKEKKEKEAAAAAAAATAKAKAEADRLEKERLEKEKEAATKAKAEADRLEKEQAAAKAKEEADRLEKEKAERQPTTKITDAFKLTIEKQLKEKMENKTPTTVESESSSSGGEYVPQKLANLTLDRAKVSGRKLPSKSHKPPLARPATGESTAPPTGASLLAQALESKSNSDSESSPTPKKKIVLPPGAAGLMGGMAALAAEAQKKKLEKDNNKNNAALNRLKVEEPEAPVFVKGRSQSVSVTSTLKGDTTGKFLVHKKVVDTYSGLRTRLIHCKGKKRILTREVEVTTRSLNKTDTFVLDCGIEGSGVGGESSDSSAHTNIYVWYGSKSNAAKKSKAVAIAEIIKSHERGGHATIIKLDESDRDADATEFYRRMHGKADDYIMPDGGDDMEAEQTWPQSFNLLKYNQDNGQLISVDSKALSMELLASDSFFVLDTGSEYYAWSGRNADIPAYKDKFLEKAKERLTGNNQRPAWVEMIVTSEGGEPVMFREKYFDWPDLSHEVSLSRMGFGKKRVFDVSIPYEKKSPLKMSQFDVQEMIYSEPPEEAPHRSDGTGTYEMWYVDNMKILPIPEEEYGHFYSGNCYLIRYTYTRWNALKYIIYIWQGADATRQDVGSSSLLSKDMYIETCNRGDCIQDCVRQGRENVQFYMVFNGRMVVHRGVRGDFDSKSKQLYHLYGKRDNTITAVQTTKLSASCLNSRDIFVLTDSNTTYMWEGSGASKVLKEQAAKLATLIVNSPSKSAATIQEGQEPEEFWKMLGGKAKYANDQLLKHPKSVKLFAIVNTGTIIRSDEVFNFNQYELQANRVFILDNKVKMYVWSGSRATEKEKKRGMEIAIEYIKLLNDGRAEEDVLFIKEKDEPVEFTCQFHAWDSFRFLNANGADTEESPKVESASTLLKKYYQTLPLEMLTQKNTPPEIDRSVLEMYLSDEEFQKVLGMQKTEWEVLPGWKKSERKKSVGLF